MKESLEKKTKQRKTSIKEFHTAFIRCPCYNEVLVAHYDKESDSLDFCLYETQSSFKHKMTLWQKFRYIYQLLKTGQLYTDQIILERFQIEELKSFLNHI